MDVASNRGQRDRSAALRIHEYSPALGLGKFMVVEVPEPSSVAARAGAAFAERIPKALDALGRAQHELHSGEWPEVIKALRPAWELLPRRR